MSLAKPKTVDSAAEKAGAPASENADASKPGSQRNNTKAPSRYTVGRKLSSFRRKLNAYTRVKTRVLAALKGEKEEKAEDAPSDAKADDAEKKPVSKVLECYRLVRNFALTYNWLTLDVSENRGNMLTIPDKFAPELKKVLTEEVLTKFLEAMQGSIQDVVSILPAEFDDAKVQKVLKFVDENDQEHIIDKLKKEIDSLNAELTILNAKKSAEPSAESSKKKVAAKTNVISNKAENSKSKNKDFDAETMFKDMILQIKKRIATIRFMKDDFQCFAEVQGQIDLLLFDANHELHQIKKSIKKKFENAQKA